MLGPPKPRRIAEPVAVSLEALVPVGHFYRHLETKLALGFVRDWVREFYADRGRPSVDPVVFFKLQFAFGAEADVYRYPLGEVLRPLKRRQAQPVRIYQASAAACNACPLKAQCTTSPRGRRVARHLDEAYLDRVRACHGTESYKQPTRKRQV